MGSHDNAAKTMVPALSPTTMLPRLSLQSTVSSVAPDPTQSMISMQSYESDESRSQPVKRLSKGTLAREADDLQAKAKVWRNALLHRRPFLRS